MKIKLFGTLDQKKKLFFKELSCTVITGSTPLGSLRALKYTLLLKRDNVYATHILLCTHMHTSTTTSLLLTLMHIDLHGEFLQ